MAQLSTIISSILRDMVLAQHEANLYAVTLSEAYRKDGRMENFSLPAIALGEMELDIHYGIKDIEEHTEQYEINYAELRRESKMLCNQLASVIVSSITASVQASGLDDNPRTSNLVEQIAILPDVKRKFCAFLSRKILKSLQNDFTKLVNDDGTVNKQMVFASASQTADEEFLHHKDLTTLFGSESGEQVRAKAKNEMKEALEMILPKLLKDINLKRKRLMPSIEVIVSSEELAKLPDESIHSFRFKVSPNSLNLNVLDNDNLSI